MKFYMDKFLYFSYTSIFVAVCKSLHINSHLCRYNIMLSCWSHDPLKRPSFRKLVEKTELLLSENTKNVSKCTIEMIDGLLLVF